jgi:hypothetical protein
VLKYSVLLADEHYQQVVADVKNVTSSSTLVVTPNFNVIFAQQKIELIKWVEERNSSVP